MKISSKEDKREVVDWAYRILLEREPDPDAKYYINMEPFSLRKIKYSIFDSKEYIEKFIINVANLNGTLVYLNPLDLDISENVRYGRYEPHIYSVFKGLLQPNMNFLDVGANIGFYSLTAAKIVGDAGIVIACEPLQKNAQAILLSILANKLENVRVLPFAASDIAFQAITMISHSATANAHVGNTTIGQFGSCTQTIILDDFLTSLSRLNAVKMDIESFELRAFRGMKKTLQKFVPNFITEFHPYAFQIISGDDPLEYLEEIKSIYKSISVIKKDGKLLSCDKVCDIMAYWQRVNDDAGTDGRLQIDLLAH